MAGFDESILLGVPTNTTSPVAMGGGGGVAGAGQVGPHHGLVVIVLVATLVLFLLDRAGFRFAVAVGRK